MSVAAGRLLALQNEGVADASGLPLGHFLQLGGRCDSSENVLVATSAFLLGVLRITGLLGEELALVVGGSLELGL